MPREINRSRKRNERRISVVAGTFSKRTDDFTYSSNEAQIGRAYLSMSKQESRWISKFLFAPAPIKLSSKDTHAPNHYSSDQKRGFSTTRLSGRHRGTKSSSLTADYGRLRPAENRRLRDCGRRVFARFTLTGKENERNGAGQVPAGGRAAPCPVNSKKVRRGRLNSRRKLRRASPLRYVPLRGRIGGRIDRARRRNVGQGISRRERSAVRKSIMSRW